MREVGAASVSPGQLAALVVLVGSGKVSGTAAKQVFAEMWKTGGDPQAIVNALGLAQTSDESAIAAAVDEVVRSNPKAVEDYRRGNARALDGLVGPVMGRMKGKADGAVVRRLLLERLGGGAPAA
jgi:aspartyl-tRNA(Asn)/glutamyl-tRNA(Gln) amidotransferase subunit B